MELSRAFGECIATFAFRVTAAVNLLFVLFFVAILVLVTGKARAEDGSCDGTDLVEALQGQEAERLKQMKKEAAAIPNGKGLLWRVSGPAGATSYVFGTMHVTDPRVVTLPARVQQAFEESRTIIIETTDVLDRKGMMAAMAKRPELTTFPAGELLTDHLSAEERKTVDDALAARGVPLQSVVKMKPWMLVSVMSLPECELRRQREGALVLDAKLAADARAAGKEVAGLESMEEQLAAMASLPMELHIDGLVSTLRLGDQADDVIETLIGLYLDEETGMFKPALEKLLPNAAEGDSYAAFEEAMVTARNRTMAERATPFLQDGGAFIAVGAMHLPGEMGLIALLREAGFTVSRAD